MLSNRVMVADFTRRELLAAGAAVSLGCRRADREETKMGRMPVLFVGHGSPMNAIEDTPWSRAWRTLAQTLPTPKAVLCISAHWFVGGTWVTGNAKPETIHDFGGFPQPLFEVQYPASGDQVLARRVSALLERMNAAPKDDWGLDHGTWSVMRHLRPKADVPVLQLSIDRRAGPASHLEIGRALQPLRDEGVLIVGSGNMTHNLRFAFSSDGVTTPPWAATFDSEMTKALEQKDSGPLVKALGTEAGAMSHPTPDHYLPLLYAMGASTEKDAVSFPVTGFDYGSLSMRSVLFTA